MGRHSIFLIVSVMVIVLMMQLGVVNADILFFEAEKGKETSATEMVEVKEGARAHHLAHDIILTVSSLLFHLTNGFLANHGFDESVCSCDLSTIFFNHSPPVSFQS